MRTPTQERRVAAATELVYIRHSTGLRVKDEPLDPNYRGEGEQVLRISIGGWKSPFFIEFVEAAVPCLGRNPVYRGRFDILADAFDSGNPEDPPVDTDPYASHEYMADAVKHLVCMSLKGYLEEQIEKRRTA